MRYVMKQKLFSWGDDFIIKDADGNDVYSVDGKVFPLREQLSFQDMSGNELALVRKKLFAWGLSYEIFGRNPHTKEQKLLAVVRKDLFTLFRCTFTVDVPGPDDLSAEGNLTEHEYRFQRGSRTVAAVSKRWFTWTDTYGVDIDGDEDPVLILASTVVIDMACHPDEERNS